MVCVQEGCNVYKISTGIVEAQAIDILTIDPKLVGWFWTEEHVTPWEVAAQVFCGQLGWLAGRLVIVKAVTVVVVEHLAPLGSNRRWCSIGEARCFI